MNERVKRAESLGLRHHEGYERVLAEAAELRLRKAHSYGESRYEEPDEDFNMSGVFWDIYRKWIRLRQMFKHGWRKMAHAPDGLRDALLDMANYCLMGVQLMDSYLPARPEFPVEQIALKVPDVEKAKEVFRAIGVGEWAEDRVEAWIREPAGENIPRSNTARLAFNYQLIPGKELELIEYEKGWNWLAEREDSGIPFGLSHLGLHVPEDTDLDAIKRSLFDRFGFEVAQEVKTMSHTNPAIRDTRRYRYVIFDSHNVLGFDLKLIQRIHLSDGANL